MSPVSINLKFTRLPTGVSAWAFHATAIWVPETSAEPGGQTYIAPVSYLHYNKGSRSIGERHREGQSYIPINSRYLAQKSRVDQNRAQEPYPGPKPCSADQFGPARAQTISIRISSTQKTIAGITLIVLTAPGDGRKSGHTKSAHCC